MPTLDFKGKHHIYAHHLSVPYRPLKPDASRSCNPSGEEDNLIIHGDNLHALKALLPRYANRVKCIYIDPPYNTGSQAWVYNDRVNSPLMKAWFAENSPVDGEDLERHDKWLCMMWPRLHLLKELLSDDGVIFVSIDHHEAHRLRLIMDEIFGAETFITCLAAVLNLKGSRDNRGFTTTHESVLVYEKVPGSVTLHEVPLQNDETDEWIQDDVGWFKKGANLKYSGENAPREKRPNLFYPIYVGEDGTVSVEPKTDKSVELWPITSDGQEVTWRWGRETIEANPNEIIAIQSGDNWFLHKKQRPKVGVVPSKKPKSTFYSPQYSATTATTIVKEIFENTRTFDYPKSPHFLSDLINIAGVGPNDIVLDSFAGSGTTAHAVLALNKEDGGNRKFILIECEEYADTITAERVRRVINGVEHAKDKTLQEGLGGSFTYCTLGEPIEIEAMLIGESLPSYSVLAAHLLFAAAGISVGGKKLDQKNDDGLFYADNKNDYYLHYQPDLAFLSSDEALLKQEHAERIRDASRQKGKKAIVYAAGNYIGQRELTKMGIVFCQLPYVL